MPAPHFSGLWRNCAGSVKLKFSVDKPSQLAYSNSCQGEQKGEPKTRARAQKGRSQWPRRLPASRHSPPLSTRWTAQTSTVGTLPTMMRRWTCLTRCLQVWASPARPRLARPARLMRTLQSICGRMRARSLPLRKSWPLATLRFWARRKLRRCLRSLLSWATSLRKWTVRRLPTSVLSLQSKP